MKRVLSLFVMMAIVAMSVSVFSAEITAPVTENSATIWDTSSRFIFDLTEDTTYVYVAFSIKGPATFCSAQIGLTVDDTKVLPWNTSTDTAVTTAAGATAAALINKNSFIPSSYTGAGTYRTTVTPKDYVAGFGTGIPVVNVSVPAGVTQPLFTAVFKKQAGYKNISDSGLAIFSGTLGARATKIVSEGAKNISNIDSTNNAPLATYYIWNLPAVASEYKVTFNLNYDGAPASAQVDTVDGKVSEPEAPSRTGYTFGGWYEDAGCTTAYDFDTVLTADKILYAKWTENAPVTHTVTFKAEGNTVATKTVNHGSDLTDIPAVPEKVGYTGVWDTTNFTNITDDMTVNAVYTIKTYTITFKAEGNTVATKTVNHGANLTDIPAVPSKPGYTGAWDTTNFANITADMTVNAVYTEIPAGAAITLTNNASGSVKVGNKFNVPVTVTGIDSFRAIAFTMSYDTAKLKYKGYVAHENFSTQVVDPAEVAAVNGTAVFAFGASDGDELTGSTVVATLEFEALAATDSTEISLSNVIYAVNPTSDDVNISNITNTTVSIIDNTAPVISGLKITGVPAVGQELTAEYTYSDADNNAESGTTFAWYSADTVDGTYTLISGANTNKLTLTEDLLNKYIKVVVTPNDGITFGIDYSAFTADKVTSIIPGDVHQDGKVQLGDALLVMDYLEGKTILTDSQKIAADISGDGQILAEDVVKILLKAAKAK